MKKIIKLLIFVMLFTSLLVQSTFAAALLTKAPEKIPILMYHHISADKTKWGPFVIPPAKFKEEICYIKALGYNTISFKDYLDYKNGKAKLPNHPIIITFDDGYYSNYQFAFPLLKKYRMKATIFAIGWSIGRKLNKDNVTPIYQHFTFEQAKEMQDSGLISIQYHTFDMHNEGGVKQLPDEKMEDYECRLRKDMRVFKAIISNKLKTDTYVFAYPFGISTLTSEKIAKEEGFKFTLTTAEGVSDFSTGTYLLKRINMSNNISSVNLMKKILKYENRNVTVPFADVLNQPERIKMLEALFTH